ncbi:MAG TPA: BadF/BadG/BcrA/BcrD ATPase family protein [Rhizomicrobium sp.]|nr:BadF/BadG/BcrA/BcrD ATPase family protein [Rhizomicrobium sp.]
MTTAFLGIDAGGTHCRARLISPSGDLLGEGEGGPANTRIGIELLHQTILDVAEQAFANAHLTKADFSGVAAGIGIAGISRPGALDQLQNLSFPFQRTEFASDAAIANLGAHRGRDGAILILGTGSIGHVRVGGASFTIGGYGFPISDEASGAALGLSAMRHALRALDGRTKPTPLSSAVTGKFDHSTPRIVAWMDAATPRDYGSFAPLVLDCAEAGDEIAISIVEDAVLHIERFIETIFRRGAPRLALMGGLAGRYRPWLRARTASRLSEPLGDALEGALILAGYRAVEHAD